MIEFDVTGPCFEIAAAGTVGPQGGGHGRPLATERLIRKEVMVITVQGAVDAFTVPRLGEAIGNALGLPAIALVVDLSAVDFLASAGMAALLSGHRAVMAPKRFCVVAEGRVTERPIRVTGLDRELDLYPTLAAALSNLN